VQVQKIDLFDDKQIGKNCLERNPGDESPFP
jgi:hypothetical protein